MRQATTGAPVRVAPPDLFVEALTNGSPGLQLTAVTSCQTASYPPYDSTETG